MKNLNKHFLLYYSTIKKHISDTLLFFQKEYNVTHPLRIKIQMK